MKRKGFTLVELLAVVVVLGILITIAVPAVNRVIKHAEKVSIYQYANKIIQNSSTQSNKLINEVEKYSMVEEVGIITPIDTSYLGNKSKYSGYLLYNYLTDEIIVYVYDDKNMVYGLSSSDSRNANDVVKKLDKDIVDKDFNYSSICKSQEKLNICLFENSNGGIDYYYKRLPGEAIVNGTLIHNIIRQITNPGSVEYTDWQREDSSDKLSNIHNVVVQTVTSQPEGSINISPVLDGEMISDTPVYLWFKNNTLYFGSETGEVDLYLDASNLFSYMSELTTLDLSQFNFCYMTSIAKMFRFCEKLETINTEGIDFTFLSSAYGTFEHCKKLKTFNFNDWQSGHLIDIERMFNDCKSIEQIDVSRWDTSRLKTLAKAFTGCEKLVSLDVSNWDTGNIEKFDSAFQNDYSLTYLNVSRWDTSKAVSMNWLVCGDGKLLEMDVSNWDTRNIEYLNFAFANCQLLKELDLSNWDISKVKEMNQIFQGLSSVKKIKFGKNKNNNKIVYTTNGVAKNTVGTMIYNCKSLEYLDLSNFEKLPVQDSYGDLYSSDAPNTKYDITFLVSNSYTGDLNKTYYTLTKVGS